VTLDEVLKELEAAHDQATVDFGALALAELAPSRAELERLLQHTYRSVRRAALLAIAKLKIPDARTLLEPLVRDRNWLIRRDAARALGQLEDKESVPELDALLGDPKGQVREAAASALAQIGGRFALDVLSVPRDERDRAVRRAVVDALRKSARDDGLALEALAALFATAARETDRAVRDRALTFALELARGRSAPELAAALARIPKGGRTALANALAERGRSLEPQLVAQIDELRAEPVDAAAVAQFGTDMTARLRHARGPRTVRRERELDQMLDRLRSDGPRSLVLVGPSGAGKTALIEELARRLAAEERAIVPTVVLEVSTGDVMAGTRYLGEWQTRLKKLVDSIKKPKRVVWYCPDVNGLVDAGRTVQNETECLALMLAPYLERGEIAIVGESTPELLRRGLEREPQIRKLFQTIRVEEMSPDEAHKVLGSVAQDLGREAEERSQVELAWPPDSLALALELGQVFFPGLARPGNGIRLLRETTQAAVEERTGTGTGSGSGSGSGTGTITITAPRVTRTLSNLTGVPELLLNDEVPLDLGEVRRFFSDRVLGQNEAVSAVVDLIAVIKAGLSDPLKPLRVFFFVGPTGVGKTEMAKALAEFIYGSPERLVRLDMADYQDALAFRRLTGDASAVDAAARSGKLTAPVQDRPFSVVLLDEIEKAHPSVFDLLLPVLDDGRLSDDKGRVTDFRRTIIIMTSNVGSDLKQDTRIGFSYGAPDAREKIERIMAEHFRPEFLNRIDKTVVFQPLTLEVMRKIARREVGRVLQRHGIARRKVVVDTDDSVVGLLLKEGFSERFGARPLKRRVEQLVLQPLARALVALDSAAGPTIVHIRAKGDRVSADRIARSTGDEEDEAPPRPATARIRDPRDATRRISTDELARRAAELGIRLERLELHLNGLGLRARKDQLLLTTHEVTFWDDPARARSILAEIAALEKAMEAPVVLRRRLGDLNEQLERASKAGARDVGAALVRVGERWDELARDIEFSDYAARCTEPRDRGDAYLFVRRVGERASDGDFVARLCGMYLRWAERKGLAAAPVLERIGPDERLSEAVLRIEGVCAFGLLRREEGLHQWIDRRGVDRTDSRRRDIDFARVEVLAPAPFELRDDELKVELRPQKRHAGGLMKRHRVHVVLTHDATMVSVEGASALHGPELLPEARAVLAARVAAARESASDPDAAAGSASDETRALPEVGADPRAAGGRGGIVRRYVLSNQPLARDLSSGLKAPLEDVLDGNLDDFIAHRLAVVT
jgi:ATP-dependent Clp protease ATP-binding subunit ClpC